MKKIVFPVVLLLCSIFSNAQYFQTGEDPASIKWRQINTENFQVIYPDYYEAEAQKVAGYLEKVYNYGSYSMKHKPKKISVILHTQTVKSNGLVGWAPKRSEFYTTPHQDIYPQDWLHQLALHEFRHVVQLDKVNSELPGLVKAILGEQGTALVFGGYLPWWFIEGDAVTTETALSNYGRGRFPTFLMEHKAQVVEKGVYSYDKAYNGSYKDEVPNYYRLGYFLVGNARLRYGADIWEKTLDDVAQKQPFAFSVFNSSLKEYTGMNKVKFYHSVFDSLQNIWVKEDKKYQSTPIENISEPTKRFTSYTYNHWLNDSTIISYKTALDKVGRFVSINKNGNEKNIFFPGTIFNESVNYRDNLLVWSEQIPDPRWTHSGKSLIRVLNLDNKKVNEFHPEFKGFAPCISPDKKSVVLVEADFSNNYFISVYSIYDGKLLHRFQTPDNNYFFSPEWLNDKELAVVILTGNGKRLAKVNLQKDELEILVNEDLGELKQLSVYNDKIYFISSYTGKDGLYSFDMKSKSLDFVYEPRFGSESPAISKDGKIILSNYTADGFELIELKNTEPVPFNRVKKAEYHLADELAKQELGIPDLNSADSVSYPSKKYNKTTHLLNFHSWAPAYVDADSYEITPGVSLMSQNKLGTAATTLGYKWDVDNKTGRFYAGYTYKGWYPIFSFEVNAGKKASKYYLITQNQNNQGQVVSQDTTLENYTWNHTNAEFDVRIPLEFTKGAFYRLFQPEIQYEYTNYKHNSSTPSTFFEGNFQSLTYRLYFYQLMKQASMDVYPDFGVIVDAYYRHSPIGTEDLGNLTVLQSVLYLPGLMKNHGIKIYGGFQEKNITDTYGFSDGVKYPRGWGSYSTTQLATLTGDYKMPLFYPEWSLGRVAYVQRVNASLFADFARLKGNIYNDDGDVTGNYIKDISSFGVELTGDVNFLRFYAPANIGFRASYLPEEQNMYFNFLFSIDFGS